MITIHMYSGDREIMVYLMESEWNDKQDHDEHDKINMAMI